MKSRCVVWSCVVGMVIFALFSGCTSSSGPASDPSDTTSVSLLITVPTEMDTVSGLLIIRASASPTPTCVLFDFDTFMTISDSAFPFSAYFDISAYSGGVSGASASAYWADTTLDDEVSFYIEELYCDSLEPVVLNGDTIPETKIIRGESGCVTSINLYEMGLTDYNCLDGIEFYSSMLAELYVTHNDLDSINLAPLALCPRLGVLIIANDGPTNIDLAPLAYCDDLINLSVNHNELVEIDLSPLAGKPGLEHLDIGYNNLEEIDLAPLSACNSLLYMRLSSNNLTEIDLTPIWSFDVTLLIDNNDLDSVSCAQVCDFGDAHPDRLVQSDCDCAK